MFTIDIMKIDYTPQLDFNNVLIRPKRTVLNSRSNVNMEREFTFPHSKQVWQGVPIIAANMDTTGTFGVYDVLSKHNMITCLHKFYGEKDFKNKELNPDYFMISTGINFDKLEELKSTLAITQAKWLCIDVANGYMKKMVEYCQLIRSEFPNLIIVAGNVATREIVEELIINGKIHCTNPLGLGSCADGLTPMVGDDTDTITQNCRLAKGCGATWDGVTSSTANQGNPYC